MNKKIITSIVLILLTCVVIFSIIFVGSNSNNKEVIVKSSDSAPMSEKANIAESTKAEYVDAITWEPVKNKYKKNDNLSFIVQSKNKSAKYVFQLQVKKGKTWEIIVPWQSWPLPNYSFKDDSGWIGLQVDIREDNDKNNIQHVWLGQFFVSQFG